MSNKKMIVVVGATGGQGGGLVRSILGDPNSGFAARAVTRDVNSERAKALAKLGQFEYYGTSTGNTGTSFVVDSGKVIVTFSASGS